jgi:hypothetical protein
LRSSLKGIGGIGLRRHGVEQKAQRRFRVFAVDAAVFLISGAATVVDHAEQRQGGLAFGRVDPIGFVDMFEIRGRNVELPAVVAVFGLEADGRRLAGQAWLIKTPECQIAVHGGPRQQAFRNLHQAFGGLHAIVFQQLDGPPGGQVASIFVGGPEFEGGNQFAIAFQLRAR